MTTNKPAANDKYDAILDLIFDADVAAASVAFAPINLPGYLADGRRANMAKAKAARDEAIKALSFDEMIEFHAYRTAVKAYYDEQG
jgi:hypothetical protein